MSTKKAGQLFSYDFIISAMVFLFFFSTFFFVWDYLNRQIVWQSDINDMQGRAALLSDVLVRTSGYPANWTAANVETIGLAATSEENVIDPGRLAALNATDYATARNIMGLGQKYGVHLQLNDTSNNTIFTYGQYPSSPTAVVPINRYVLYDNSTSRPRATLRLIVWS